MSNTIHIRFKATGEHFDIPYRLQTTIDELIEYVCKHSTVLSNTNPDDYYMAINNSDVLNGNRTVEEIGLNRSDRFNSLEVCIKTQILAKRILQSHWQLWQPPNQPVQQKEQQTTAIEKSNKTGMKRETNS
jgi:hypothetical protein